MKSSAEPRPLRRVGLVRLHALSSCLTKYIHDNLRSVHTHKAFIFSHECSKATSLQSETLWTLSSLWKYSCERMNPIRNSLMTSQSEPVMVRKIPRVSNPVTNNLWRVTICKFEFCYKRRAARARGQPAISLAGILGECSALWGELEGVVWCISVP